MQRAEQLDSLLRTATREGMETAIARHGAGLTSVELNALRTLTPHDILQLGSLRNKLSPLTRAAAADNIGGIF